ncbi:hypothetical protein RHMOL_Rhmol05G0141800 [Rhododendron molle]|uniref:Uncharacterized protein n=1 Tax=Rhododendron molle TaxID=49168 RepID=A0ACC0NNS3_RHOML|nr:hypothetical protein RHMOL_Rhmol05G0141800 [Rhododendron molle]
MYAIWPPLVSISSPVGGIAPSSHVGDSGSVSRQLSRSLFQSVNHYSSRSSFDESLLKVIESEIKCAEESDDQDEVQFSVFVFCFRVFRPFKLGEREKRHVFFISYKKWTMKKQQQTRILASLLSVTMMAMKGSRSLIRQFEKVISTLTADSLTILRIQVLLCILPWPMDSIPRTTMRYFPLSLGHYLMKCPYEFFLMLLYHIRFFALSCVLQLFRDTTLVFVELCEFGIELPMQVKNSELCELPTQCPHCKCQLGNSFFSST